MTSSPMGSPRSRRPTCSASFSPRGAERELHERALPQRGRIPAVRIRADPAAGHGRAVHVHRPHLRQQAVSGPVTFTFKLSVRLALMKAAVVLAAAAIYGACDLPV